MNVEEVSKQIADYLDNDTNFSLADNGYIVDIYIDKENSNEGENGICVEIDNKNDLVVIALKSLAGRVPDVVPHLERQYAKAEGFAHKYLHIRHRQTS